MDAGCVDSKRRLPIWMTGPATVGQNSESKGIQSSNNEQYQEKLEYKGKGKGMEVTYSAKSLGRKKRKKRNLLDGTGCENRKLSGSRRKRKSKRIEEGEEFESSLLGENDEDLTMEDLISIAEEYVKEDEYVGRNQSFTPHQDVRILENEESIPICVSQTKDIVVEPNVSGDPTQDMLNLFLGPLLKRSKYEENENANLITEEMNLTYEMKKQNQSVVHKEEQAPLTKKKSSLKDKVAMFF